MAWTPPTKEELNTLIDKLGGTGKVSHILKKHRNTVIKWRNGTNKIDFANWDFLKRIE